MTFLKRKKKKDDYNQESVPVLTFLLSCIVSSLFLSILDDWADRIDVSGIVPVVFAEEAIAAADTQVNNCNQIIFPHS